MKNLLHIVGSPRGEHSISSFGAETFVSGLKARAPALVVNRLDIWADPLPTLDGAALQAKYARLQNKELDTLQSTAWGEIEAMVARLSAADAILLSTPMWNFGIPYRLKHYIDLITQPGLTFAFDSGAGYRPLLKPRPVMIVLASAGDYSEGSSWGRPDLVTGYLREALGFIGLSSPRFETVGPTAGDPETILRARKAAETRLLAAARDFGEPE